MPGDVGNCAVISGSRMDRAIVDDIQDQLLSLVQEKGSPCLAFIEYR